jgi:predicted RNA-binding Zn ribbon-like protein
VTDRGDARAFDLLGGRAALDFVNTVEGIRGGVSTERINGYEDLVAWALQADLITRADASALRRWAAEKPPQEIARVLARSIALREALYRIFSSVAAARPASDSDLTLLSGEAADAALRSRLTPAKPAFRWQLLPQNCGVLLPTLAVARDASELLTSPHLREVRECASDTCGWLFLDKTRNHSRVWCNMAGCGNRMKQRRFRGRG